MRSDANADLLRKRNQLSKFLLRLGLNPPEKVKAWSLKYQTWLESIRFEDSIHRFVLNQHIHAIFQAKTNIQAIEKEIENTVLTLVDLPLYQALQSLRGVGPITAATLIAEVGDITRFKKASQLMSYVGLVPREHSSGNTRWQGKITKAGNSHIRFVTVEASWHYRHNPRVGKKLSQRQNGLSEEIKQISWRAQNRLHRKYATLMVKGKPRQKAVVAVARELLGFIWEIAQQVTKEKLAA